MTPPAPGWLKEPLEQPSLPGSFGEMSSGPRMSPKGRHPALGSRYQWSRNRLKSDLRLPVAVTLCGLGNALNLGIRLWLPSFFIWRPCGTLQATCFDTLSIEDTTEVIF
jgi:hypothetical protein